MKRKGSISIETAIAFSIVLVLMACMINIMSLHRTNIIMQASVEASCEKFAVLAPLSVPAADSIYTIVNSLPNSDALESKTASVVASIGSAAIGIDMASGGSLTELLLDGTLGQLMRDDIAYEYGIRNGSGIIEPENIEVNVYLNSIHHILDIEVNYKTTTILGTRTRCVYSVIPLYGDFNLLLNPDTESAEEQEDIWSAHNFTRGHYFREKYGANYPQTFPIVDRFYRGNAESIMSIDLTAPTYNAGGLATYQRICEEIDGLAGFDGADVIINGSRYIINESDITRRTLRVIVPENSTEQALNEVLSAINYGNMAGVDVIICKDGVSTRYS